jgi:hypothetical protein
VLGAANHIGNHFGAFDRLFYDVNPTTKANSKLFLNVLEEDHKREIDSKTAQLTLAAGANPNPFALAAAITAATDAIDFSYRIKVRTLFCYPRQAAGLSFPGRPQQN